MPNFTFETYHECKDFFIARGIKKRSIEYFLAHERYHFNKALELGYIPLYGISCIVDFPPIILAGFVQFEGRIPQGHDMIDILLSPKHPSPDDISQANQLESECLNF